MSTTLPPWELQLLGDQSDLEFLSRYFLQPPIEVVKDEIDNCFLLRTESLAGLPTAQDVVDEAPSTLAVLSGAMRLLRDSERPLKTGAVYRRYADGRRDVAVFFHDALTVRAELISGSLMTIGEDGSPSPVVLPTPPVVSLVTAAMSLPAVAKALRLLAADSNSWAGLYRIHEVIDADVGGEHQMIRTGWVTSRQLKRFKHSANSVAVGGDESRHGKELTTPPSDPMDLFEARAYVRNVLQAWLSSKKAV